MIPDGVAYQVTRILEREHDGGTGTGAHFGRPSAGKTGTTENYARRVVLRLYAPPLATLRLGRLSDG